MIRSRYKEIAIDIATLIVNGHYSEGEKISGSASLAIRYEVSSETIRKAILLLKEFGVVNSTQKNGIRVLSSKKALLYLDENQDRTSITGIKDELEDITIQRMTLDKKFNQLAGKLITQMSAQREVGIIYPLEAIVSEFSPLIGMTLQECDFWQNTQGTVIGIKRNQIQTISPSPLTAILEHDTIIFVGKNNSYIKMMDYITYGKKKKSK